MIRILDAIEVPAFFMINLSKEGFRKKFQIKIIFPIEFRQLSWIKSIIDHPGKFLKFKKLRLNTE